MPNPVIHPEMVKNILSLVGTERTRQDLKWGEQNYDPRYWMSILGEEYGEACKGANELTFGGATRVREFHYALECIEVAAVAVATVESLMRNLPDADFDVLCQGLAEWRNIIEARWQEFITPQKVEAE